MKSLIFILLLVFIHCAHSAPKQETATPIAATDVPKEMLEKDNRDKTHKENYHEQISCNPVDCNVVPYYEYSELDEKIEDLMSTNAGKILIPMKSYALKLESDELEDVLTYLRELSKRDGRVSSEPLYIGERGAEDSLGFGFFKNSGLLGWDIYKRIKNKIKYRHTDNYNAKIIYHPKYKTIVMIFFVHKSFGDVCSTLYSDCRELNYVDDEMFDLNLSTALKESEKDGKVVRVNFKETQANLFEAKLDIDKLKQLNKSARLYKWLVLTKKTENKPISRERFLGIEAAITILDYSITLYDKLKEYQMYSPVLKTKAEVTYSGNERGGSIKSVTFSKADD